MANRALQVFVVVADTLSFSRAAEQLHMSVSAVSRGIARLEEQVGQKLLERDNRRVSLTRAGTEFREYARNAIVQWQQLQRRLNSDGELAGEVSLYCSVTASYSVLAPVLEAFRQRYTSVDVMLHTGDQADGIGRILEGQDDIAVCGRPAQLPERLSFLPLQQSQIEFVMPLAESGVRESITSKPDGSIDVDWERVPFIVPERGVTKELLDQWFSEHGITPNIYAQVAGHEAIVAMVGLGLGIGIAPQIVIDTGSAGSKVSRLPIVAGLPPLTIGLCSQTRRLESPLLQSLWEVAEETYRSD